MFKIILKSNFMLSILTVIATLPIQTLAAPTTKNKMTLPAVEVSSLIIADSEIQIPFRYPALVKSQVSGKLISETQGLVTSIKKALGDPVKKGEVVFYIKNYQVGLNFKAFAVRAPVSGVIGQMDIEIGQALKPGQVIGEVTRPDQLKVLIEIPATDLPQIERGFSANLVVEGAEVPLVIKGISPTINTSTGTAQAELRLKNNKDAKLLRSGLIGRVELLSHPTKLIRVPPRAVKSIGSKYFIRVIDKEDRIEMKEVTIGRLIGQEQVIKSGLNANDEIVIKSMDHLKAGDKVKRSNQKTKENI